MVPYYFPIFIALVDFVVINFFCRAGGVVASLGDLLSFMLLMPSLPGHSLGSNRSVFVGGLLVLSVIAWPNKPVKGTRRPLAVLKFSFLSRFGGFV